MLILVTCVCIMKQCRPNDISALNVRVCEGKTIQDISLKRI
ncbi:hypothetical protein MTR67_030328 [Solanum verrucosum]|uniref:Uncharacterized protein n=1 Tax=Solanum verrucosum TaxID=315347 RepID=A0AAF0R944_SOLVR|nr:hypothetical protein MTR67_030328 [Solanum verrucosum]